MRRADGFVAERGRWSLPVGHPGSGHPGTPFSAHRGPGRFRSRAGTGATDKAVACANA